MTATGARSPAAADPSPELVARFADALARLWPDGGRLGLAVSGGPDSLALLLLAEAAIPGRFEVATVDHGLRPASAGECAMVAQTCAARGIPCRILEVTPAPGNVQSEARKARYAALAGWADQRVLSAVATAHHADDQAETLLMRLNRGSGLSGLSGVREARFMPGSGVAVIRPLLAFRRAELRALVADAGLDPVDDPSNVDVRFDRARIRQSLAGADWLDPVALSRSACLLGEALQALEAAAETEWLNGVTEHGDGFAYCPGAGSSYIEIEVVTAIIGRMDGSARRSEVARLIERLKAGRTGNLAGVAARPITDQAEDVAVQKWLFAPEPPRRLH